MSAIRVYILCVISKTPNLVNPERWDYSDFRIPKHCVPIEWNKTFFQTRSVHDILI